MSQSFDPQALTSLTQKLPSNFRLWKCFDPQALTSLTGNPVTIINPYYIVSIHRLLRAWPQGCIDYAAGLGGFDPQALTSLTLNLHLCKKVAGLFRSTGSYEPDLRTSYDFVWQGWFRSTGSYEPDPKHLCSPAQIREVSIHRLLRAWPAKIHGFRVFFTLLFIQIIQIWYLILSLNQNPLQFTPKSRCEPPTEFMFTSGSHW